MPVSKKQARHIALEFLKDAVTFFSFNEDINMVMVMIL